MADPREDPGEEAEGLSDPLRADNRVGRPVLDDLARAKRDSLIVQDAVRGMSATKIAAKHGLSERSIHRVISDAALAVRRDNTAVVAEAFLLQNERLKRMYALVEKALQKYEADPEGAFDDRPFRIAVMLFDRQSKLLGMDKASKIEVGSFTDAPIAEVVAYAKQLQMKLPTEFETP